MAVHELLLAFQGRTRHRCFMAIILVFLLGIGNFALHRAVLESGHPFLKQVPLVFRRMGGRIGLIGEFLVLLAALLLVANDHTGWGFAYAGYSAANAVTAWLMLSRRI